MKNEITSDIQAKAVIYCRVSTKEQVTDGNSLITQERLCREYASKEGFEVTELFIEKGESAKTADRKELNRLLDFCTKKSNAIRAVIAYKIDRISRNLADYSYIKVKLNKADVEIRSVTEYFEDTPAGRFMENIIANVSQFDNEVRTERSVGGMREAVNEGRYVWNAPLGYDNVRMDKSTIAPNHLAPLIKETFQLIAQRTYPTEVIRLMMHQKGLTDKNGNPVNRAYFFRIVRNPLYKGIIKTFGMTVQGSFEPIVEPDLFDEVQAVLNDRKNTVKHYLKENPDFPLRRFVTNEGGKLLRGYWAKGKTKKYPYYSFQQVGTTIRKETLESIFLNYLQSLSYDSVQLKQLKRYLDNHFTKRVNNEEKAAVAIQERIKELDKQIDKLIELHTAEKISSTIFTSRIKKIEDERDDLLELQKSKITENVDVNGLLRSAAKALKQPHSIWQNGNLELKRAWQKFVFPKGLVFDGTNLRTPKICRLFNLKAIFDEQKFSKVTLRDTGKNTLSGTNLPLSDNIALESKECAASVMTDLLVLREIRRGNSKELKDLYEEYQYSAAA
ncbi:recombinase family protein [Mucilaginibacter ginsenosidivorans]|uniref:Recombinase family protein n=1 Tax=Mucilaginibacter ginsenosidivorans TaxID=398053 RepID=A0A5B8URN5_9SPHI|nr:recombinase family protein [Mucilaginibacter ginsenosidivorans]QEC61737.1 hypothetical protein FRZ54_03770 [Mucilaginibacter ginsenosidivorans]